MYLTIYINDCFKTKTKKTKNQRCITTVITCLNMYTPFTSLHRILLSLHYHYTLPLHITHYILITQNIAVITLPLHITSSLHRILLSLHYHYHYILITQNITVITLPLHITSSLHRILLSLHYHYHYTLPLPQA
jgi:hypothetical protein